MKPNRIVKIADYSSKEGQTAVICFHITKQLNNIFCKFTHQDFVVGNDMHILQPENANSFFHSEGDQPMIKIIVAVKPIKLTIQQMEQAGDVKTGDESQQALTRHFHCQECCICPHNIQMAQTNCSGTLCD